jgi:hypothetical protein
MRRDKGGEGKAFDEEPAIQASLGVTEHTQIGI